MSDKSVKKSLFVSFILGWVIIGFEPVLAQDVSPDAAAKTSAPVKQETTPQPAEANVRSQPTGEEAPASSGDSFQDALNKLQAQLDAQNQQIEALKAQYASEVQARQKEIDKQDKQISAQEEEIVTQRQAIQSLQQQVDMAKNEAGVSISDAEKALRSRLETVEESIKSSQEAESTTYDLKSFPGSIPIPGSSAAIKFGGFVKMNVVESFDPIGTTDRFIVGTIPVPQTSGPNVAALTVAQSRLSVEMRDTTKYGAVRAFLEADFTGTDDAFRLRHAFGQFKSFLIGKTWTTFMDSRSSPEDLDWEGINGQILLRQAQIRYFPKIGQDWHLLLSAEDPTAVIAGGTGINQVPDLVASVERDIFERWHIRTAFLFRSMYAECACLNNVSDTTSGYAISVSGKTGLTRWDERDNLQLQFSYGRGYSHYVNDLGSIDSPDAIFNANTGKLDAVPVFAMYAAFQKWWSPNMRSSFIYGYVNINNKYTPGNATAYDTTNRFSVNYIWSPIARIDLGAELLFGSRTNQDGESGNAKQVQLSAKYRY